MNGIFISYRREDSSGYSGRLYDRLRERFGSDRVFRDVNTIDPGENFVDAVRARVGSAGVLLVVIGKRWVSIKDENDQPRLQNPEDLVKLEAAIALQKKIPVIPVLVDGASMPKANELPESIRGLAWANALSLSEDAFDFEFGRLCQEIDKILRRREPWRHLVNRWTLLAAGLVLLVAGAIWAIRVREQVATTRTLQTVRALSGNGDYTGAWNILKQREGVRSGKAVREAREDLAMEWLRNIHVRDQETFTAIVQELQPTLIQGVEASQGVRKGDLLAHAGWAWFLRWREGARDVEPVSYYRQALAIDPRNPFANAMTGHWLLWKGDEEQLGEARRYFAAALASGRERTYVRSMEMAALKNLNNLAGWQEYIRMLNDMRKSAEPISPESAIPLVSEFWFALQDEKRRNAYLATLPPDDQADTVRAISAAIADLPAYKRDLLDVWWGLLKEKAGHSEQALEEFRSVQGRKSQDQRVAETADAGVKRLSKR